MRIGFVLLSRVADPIPSTRIAVLNILPHLQMAGFETEVVFEPPSATETPDVSGVFQRIRERRCSVVFFQKVRGPHVVNLVRELEAAGVRTVFLTCDLVDAEMCEATTATIVVTDYLRELYPAAMQH